MRGGTVCVAGKQRERNLRSAELDWSVLASAENAVDCGSGETGHTGHFGDLDAFGAGLTWGAIVIKW